jgi:transposase
VTRASDRRKKERRQQATLKRLEVTVEEALAVVDRIKSTVSAEDHAKLKAAIDTLAFVTRELEAKATSLSRLRQMLFGSTTEKTSEVIGPEEPEGEAQPAQPETTTSEGPRPKAPGHGRIAAAALTGAEKVKVLHPSLHSGDGCPECAKGKVYPLAEPAVLVRITGMAPLGATVYEKDRLRCNLCGKVYTAPSPAGVGEEKYDETATGMVGLLKYGAGVPFNRIEKLQQGMGIPLPASTQWELVSEGAKSLTPAHDELVRQAAQGKVLHNDDTTMKVLELTGEQRAAAAADEETSERTGVFTSGIVSTQDDHKVGLFFTGVKHAGENLADVLKQRAAALPKPIQMCDALPVNTAGDFETIVANCLAHARRRFVEVVDSFPDECRYVLETLREVYKNDATAKKEGMSPEQRLSLHQEKSGPLMDGLEEWIKGQFEERKVEPNSGLGEAMTYMKNHWSKLTLFLQVAGSPLDNNIVERALKKAILHRKNSLYFRTLNGARVGDVFMSLIHTAELNGVKPFSYLIALLRHAEDVAVSPADWMPWNYRQALAQLRAETGPPA